eukprot:TRINITY_DN7022_c0_g1_i1.p1 TRINITY_DN7022_c0_g1~~TRINITY_DN7022_c0_g1_i1.p1  ORF type:complete len:816 (+),score=185.47 TRINITY_DN7022_c0_g1_i1:108-2555(+)
MRDGHDSDEEQLQRLRRFAASLERGLGASLQRTECSPGHSAAGSAAPRHPCDSEYDKENQTPPDIGNLPLHERLFRQGRERSRTPTAKAPQSFRRAPSPWDQAADGRRRDLYIDAECRKREQRERAELAAREARKESGRPKMSGQSGWYLQQQRQRMLSRLFARHAKRAEGECGEATLSYEGVANALDELGFFQAQGGSVQHEGTRGRDEFRGQVVDKVWAAMLGGSGAAYVGEEQFVQVLAALYEEARCRRGSLQQLHPPRRPPPPVPALGGPVADSAPAAPPVLAAPHSTERGTSQRRCRSAGSAARAGDGGARIRSHSAGTRGSQASAALTGVFQSAVQKQVVVCQQLMDPLPSQRHIMSASEQECTFAPHISSRSQQIVRDKRRPARPGEQPPRFLELVQRNTATEEKLRQLRQRQEEQELQGCTFKPAIKAVSTHLRRCNDDEVTPLGQLHPQRAAGRRRAAPVPDREAEQLRHCTFEPRVNSTYNRPSPQPLPNGFLVTVERMRGRRGSYDARKFEDKLRGSDPATLSEPLRPTVVQPFRLRTGYQRERKPLLHVEVRGGARHWRIAICEGDTAEELARSHAVAHQLDRNQERRLRDDLQRYISELIPRAAADRDAATPSAHRVATDFAGSAARIEQLAAAELEQGGGPAEAAGDSPLGPPPPDSSEEALLRFFQRECDSAAPPPRAASMPLPAPRRPPDSQPPADPAPPPPRLAAGRPPGGTRSAPPEHGAELRPAGSTETDLADVSTPSASPRVEAREMPAAPTPSAGAAGAPVFDHSAAAPAHAPGCEALMAKIRAMELQFGIGEG